MSKIYKFHNRIFTSVKRHGLKNFVKIANLRVKHALQVSPEFANYYKLPNSEFVLEGSKSDQKIYINDNSGSELSSETKNRDINLESLSLEANTALEEKQILYINEVHTCEPLFPDHVVVIFSGVPFDDVGGGQRPAQFARVLLAQGKKVIYIYAYKKFDFALGHYIDSTISIPNLEHYHVDDIQPDDLALKLRANSSVLFELPHKAFMPYANLLWSLETHTVFDLIDEWDTSLGGDWFTYEIMQQFVDSCTVVCGSAKLLRDKLIEMGRKDALYIPNAANEQIFDLYKNFNTPPPEYTNSDRYKCLYFGSLYGEWFGWDYLIAAAETNLNCDFYLIGDYGNQKVLPKNVYAIGSRNIEELPAYLYYADVALLPFIPGKISDAVSPIKIFEYLFMGKPVVATLLPEIVNYPNVFIGKDPQEYATLIKEAILSKERNTDEIEKFISTNSWAFRLQNILPKRKAEPSVSAVILIRNNERIIRRCLASLLENGSRYLKEIIVVDNDSNDNGPAIVANEFPQVTLLYNSKNGCSSGRNLGISRATGEYVAFFDSDQWVTSEGCFEEAISVLSKFPFVGAVGWAAGWIDRKNENYGGMIMDYLPNRGMLINSNFRTDIGYLGTGGFFIKKSVLDRTKLFDEFYDPTAFEDTDICFQLLNLGYKLAYRDLSGIRHQPHQTTNASSGSDAYNKLFERNANHFKAKWGNKEYLFSDYRGY